MTPPLGEGKRTDQRAFVSATVCCLHRGQKGRQIKRVHVDWLKCPAAFMSALAPCVVERERERRRDRETESWLYLLMAGRLQRVLLDFVLPLCVLPHLHVHLHGNKKLTFSLACDMSSDLDVSPCRAPQTRWLAGWQL